MSRLEKQRIATTKKREKREQKITPIISLYEIMHECGCGKGCDVARREIEVTAKYMAAKKGFTLFATGAHKISDAIIKFINKGA